MVYCRKKERQHAEAGRKKEASTVFPMLSCFMWGVQNDGIDSQRRTFLYKSHPEFNYVLRFKQKTSCISARLLHTPILEAIAYDTQGIVGYDTGSLTGVTLATGTEQKADCHLYRIYRKIFWSFTEVKCFSTLFNAPLLTSPNITQFFLLPWKLFTQAKEYLTHLLLIFSDIYTLRY